MGPPVIRAARRHDRARVEELLVRAGLPIEGVDEHLQSFFVEDDGRQVLGAAGLELYGEHALLRSVVVADTLRRAGLGSTLTRRALHEARACGVRAVYLVTTTAKLFFERLGFERATRGDVPARVQSSHELQGACPSSAVVMRRQLSPTRRMPVS